MDDKTDQKERLDWIEKAGLENMKLHHACADTLSKEAATTLTLSLAGMGGGLAYAAKSLDQGHWTWFAVGAAAFTAWLCYVSWYLTTKCLMMREIDQVYNEPKNLDSPDDTLEYLRRCELLSLQIRIDSAGQRNARLAGHLNKARKFAIGSPLVFIFFSLAWVALGH
ncbi:hypothetical protein ACQUFY_08545 [Robbsia andropogonis]|uniref:hypothetical protein n=1 Tax=Robbsia andropogonis TaxID=28092 RepID=UPI003D1A60F4